MTEPATAQPYEVRCQYPGRSLRVYPASSFKEAVRLMIAMRWRGTAATVRCQQGDSYHDYTDSEIVHEIRGDPSSLHDGSFDLSTAIETLCWMESQEDMHPAMLAEAPAAVPQLNAETSPSAAEQLRQARALLTAAQKQVPQWGGAFYSIARTLEKLGEAESNLAYESHSPDWHAGYKQAQQYALNAPTRDYPDPANDYQHGWNAGRREATGGE